MSRSKQLTVLIDQHADGDSAKVEAIQEVLDILVGDRVVPVSFLVFDHTLRHGRDHIIVAVPDGDQGVCEPRGTRILRKRAEMDATAVKLTVTMNFPNGHFYPIGVQFRQNKESWIT